MRNAEIDRKTAETDIRLRLELDGTGEAEIDSGCGFLDHMLTLFAAHGLFDLRLSCRGDTRVDYHHSTEDTGICLGRAFAAALPRIAMSGLTPYFCSSSARTPNCPMISNVGSQRSDAATLITFSNP